LAETPDILKLRILLCFQNEISSVCTVTGLSKMLGEGKQKISRELIAMEKEGLLDRTDNRRPVLTEAGRKMASYYEERTNTILNHLLYEGLDIDNAEHDSYIWALFSSEAGYEIIKNSEQRYHAKYSLRKRRSFNGEVLCSYLKDGEYRFPFLIYREHMVNGKNLSMANEGFEHPCSLVIKDGKGIIRLKPLEISHESLSTGMMMNGKVRNLQYRDRDNFKPAQEDGEYLCIPVDAVSFLNIGSGIGQILHGSVWIKMRCSVGTKHMPESEAVFTLII
jgi:Mn-dependent DtxR family transcriptional regulator